MATFVWPFCPISEDREDEYTWNTDVLEYYAGEQRIALREFPIFESSQQFQLSTEEMGFARKILEDAFADGNYIKMPAWTDRVQITTGPGVGYEELSGDFRYSRFKEGGECILWKGPTSYETNIVTRLSEDKVELLDPYTVTSNAPVFIAPLIEGNIKDRVSIDTKIPVRPAITLNFISRYDRDEWFFDIPEYTYNVRDYLGETVILFYNTETKRARETIIRSSAEFKTPSGQTYYQYNDSYLTNMYTLHFNTTDAANRYAILKWLYSLKGKQKGFWLPSPNPDLRLQANMTQTNRLDVRWAGNPSQLVNQNLCFRVASGDVYFSRVSTSVQQGTGVARLTLSTAIPRLLTAAERPVISFMHRYRLDTDTVTMKHENINQTITSVACRRLP